MKEAAGLQLYRVSSLPEVDAAKLHWNGELLPVNSTGIEETVLV